MLQKKRKTESVEHCWSRTALSKAQDERPSHTYTFDAKEMKVLMNQVQSIAQKTRRIIINEKTKTMTKHED